MLSPKTILRHMLPLFCCFFLFPSTLAAQESENIYSKYGTVLSVLPLENNLHLSIFDGTQFHTFTAEFSTPCLYQGKLITITQIQSGCQALFSCTEQKISSILILSQTSSPTTVSNIYGMYYNFDESNILITLPGGTLQNYLLSTETTYFVNNNQVTYTDFYHLTLPGDDIKIYLNQENKAIKIESYITKDESVAKTNPQLLESFFI